MNTDEVVAMIDAITEGKIFAKRWNLSEGGHFNFASDGEGIALRTSGVTEIQDPRTAREIAGALVAWANKKEGHNEGAAFLGKLAVSILNDGGVDFPSVNDWAHIKAGRDTRTNWYARNVKRMTLETLKRNKQDLEGTKAQTPPGPELDDIRRAINVIDDELYKRDQGVIAKSEAPPNCKLPNVWRVSANHRQTHYENDKCDGDIPLDSNAKRGQ